MSENCGNQIEEYAYCLFCETQKAETIAQLLENVLHVRCISPMIVQRCWKKGKEEHRLHRYLPGYIFLYSDEPIKRLHDAVRFPGVLRIIGHEEDDFALSGSDLAFAKMIRRMDGTIGILMAYKAGDRIYLDETRYGFEGRILKVDRRKGRAQIEFVFDGSTQKVWVGYDLIAGKVDERKSR